MSEENKFGNSVSNKAESSRADSSRTDSSRTESSRTDSSQTDSEKDNANGITSGATELYKIQPPEESESALAEKNELKPPKINSTQNFIAFLIFVGIIATLFLFSKANWERKLKVSQTEVDSLLNHSKELEARIEFMQKAESKRVESVIENKFDSFDAGNYRIYGLFRDASKKMTREGLSNDFNVYNAGAIQYNEVVGERWFAIPVQGVHFMQKDETLSEIAEKYYGNVKDTAIISAFNQKIEPYRHIFIPFGN